jgi:glutathione S-transferase
MTEIQLVLGNKNYSSWSLRAWLCLRKCAVNFEEVLLPLDTPEFKERISNLSPTGRVPVLWHEGRPIWDSLAICEYANEAFAGGSLWPDNLASRGLGRSMVAEMHSSFMHLRNEMPMNCRANNRHVPMNDDLQADINRVCTLWTAALTAHHKLGPWLLGEFSIADAMFAPVVMRFRNYDVSYGVEVPEQVQDYCDHLLADADMQAWVGEALKETWIVVADEAGSEQALG